MSNIYPPELTLKQTTESDPKLSYLDSICQGKFVTEVYDKRDNHIVNYPYSCAVIITARPTYGLYISGS